MFWIDKILCVFIAWGAFKLIQLAPDVSKLPPLAWHGVRTIAVSAMLAACAAFFSPVLPQLFMVSQHLSSVGINLGLCIVLYAHYKMFK